MISNVLNHNSVQGKYNGILDKTHDLQCAESQQCAGKVQWHTREDE